jgi:PPM family protein phosphatase
MSSAEESPNSREIEQPSPEPQKESAVEGAGAPAAKKIPIPLELPDDPVSKNEDARPPEGAAPDALESNADDDIAASLPFVEPDMEDIDAILDGADLLEASLDDEATDSATIPPELYNPPSIPGIRSEVTKPVRMNAAERKPSESELPIPPHAANPEMASGVRSEPTEALLDDLVGPPLDDQTLDLDLPSLQRDYSVHDIPTDDSVTVEGVPYDASSETSGPDAPEPGDKLQADDGKTIILGESLGEQDGFIFFRAKLDENQGSYTAVWSASLTFSPPWDHIPDTRIIRPVATVTGDRSTLRLFSRPKGNTVVDYLNQKDRNLPAVATLELGIQLAEILEGLHATGLQILNLDPSQIVIERGGKVRLYAISGLLPVGRQPADAMSVFAAPEVRRGLSYLIGAHSDVYSVALLVYALLARRAPLNIDLDPALLVSPRVFRSEFPTGIWPRLKMCLAGLPRERVGHARGLRLCLEEARTEVLSEAKAVQDQREIFLEAWAEVHTGLGKARRGAPQQDRAFAMTADSAKVGLYVISDGVSRSKYGDGAFAAQQVESAATKRWDSLARTGAAGLHLDHAQRVEVIREISLEAGKNICEEVNKKYAPVPNEPNQVMSATLVTAYIADGEATIGNLGDSRAYLVRNDTIERISVDHDRATDALRVGLSFPDAANVRMGAALTRIVGRVVIDEKKRAHPDPFEPEIFRVRLLPEDRLILCSDGIPDFAAGPGAAQEDAEEEMLEVMRAYIDPARASYELIVLANRGGGYDNLSCVVISAHPG